MEKERNWLETRADELRKGEKLVMPIVPKSPVIPRSAKQVAEHNAAFKFSKAVFNKGDQSTGPFFLLPFFPVNNSNGEEISA